MSPWASLDSEVNRNGWMLASGYAFDVAAGGYVGMSFSVATYPGLKALADRDFEAFKRALYDARPELAKADRLADGVDSLTGSLEIFKAIFDNPLMEVPGECEAFFMPFRFNVMASATPMTRDEFVAEQTAEARRLRTAILADATANAALVNLAADEATWVASYLAALEDSGELRPVDTAPPIRRDPKVVSVLGVLASGVLVGPAGQTIQSPSSLVAFFAKVHSWYGDTPGKIAPLAGYDVRSSDECGEYAIPIPALPKFADFDLGLSHQTYFQAFNVFSPWLGFDSNVALPDFASVAADSEITPLALQALFEQASQSQGAATISGPQGYGSDQVVPAETALPYTIRFKNPAEATNSANEVRIVSQLDPSLSARSFRLGDMKIGGINITMPRDRASFQGEFDFRQSLGFILRVSAGIDTSTRTASWVLQAIDPETGEVQQDATRGLLRPDNAQGQGSGFVSYTVASAFGAQSGVRIDASAKVLLSNQAPVVTNTVSHRLDASAPVTSVTVTQVVAGGGDYQVQLAGGRGGGRLGRSPHHRLRPHGRRRLDDLAAPDGDDHRRLFGPGRAPLRVHGAVDRQRRQPRAPARKRRSRRRFEHQPRWHAARRQHDGRRRCAPGASGDAVDQSALRAGRAGRAVADPADQRFAVQHRAGAVRRRRLRHRRDAELCRHRPARDHRAAGRQFPRLGRQQPRRALPLRPGRRPRARAADAARHSNFRPRLRRQRRPLGHLGRRRAARTRSGDIAGRQPLRRQPDPVARLRRRRRRVLRLFRLGHRALRPGQAQLQPFQRRARRRPCSRTRRHALGQPLAHARRPAQLRQAGAGPRCRCGSMPTSIRSPSASAGTQFENLLFATSRVRTGDAGASLWMVDLVTLRRVELARGGPGAEQLIATSDGRLLIADGKQVDVIAPLVAPKVLRVTPADGAFAPLPMGEISVVFDHDMLASSPTAADSVTNVANYQLSRDGAAIAIRSIRYDAASRTATIRVDSLEPGSIEVTVRRGVRSGDGLALAADFKFGFLAISDFSPYVRIDFEATRSDRLTGTVSYDLRATNIADFDLRAPLQLVLDPARFFGGAPAGSTTTGGVWLIDLAGTGAGLKPGESSVLQTVTLSNPTGQRADLGTGIYALPYANSAPLLQSTPVTQAAIGTEYRYQLQAVDPDGVGLRYLLLSGPEGMALDASGLLAWTPSAGTAATAAVALRVFDTRGASATQAFGIDVAGGNHAPALTGLQPLYTLREGEFLRIAFDAFDSDGQTIGLAADNLPPGMVFDAVGRVLEWLPDFSAAGIYRDLRILASDGRLTTQASIQVTVLPANAPPELASVSPRIVREGDPIRIQFRATDLDGDKIAYSSPNLPAGAFFDPNTGAFEWTPAFTQAGHYSIGIWADDNKVRSQVLLDLTVTNVNAAPVFDSLLGLNVLEGEAISFRAFAFDPDNPEYAIPDRFADGRLSPYETTAPTVSYVATGLPAGATFDPVTAFFDWRPGYTQVGTYQIRFTATDDGNGTGVALTSTITVPVTVRNANRQPVVPAIGTQTVAKGQVLELPIAVDDADGDKLALRFDGLPRFATFTPSGNGTGVLRMAPGDRDRGDYVVTLVASDDGDGEGPRGVLSASRTFVISADSPTEPPLFAPIGDKVAVVGTPLRFTIRASDLDQDALVFDAAGLPAGATLVPGAQYGSAVFEWTPASADIGTHPITFTVTDSTGGSDQRSITLEVRTANSAPLLLPVGDRLVAEGDLLVVDLAASDGDGDTISYSATGLPLGAKFDTTTGRLTWATNYFNAGTYAGITVVASDGAASSSDTFAITVTPVNRAPLLAGIPPVGGQEDRLLQFTLIGGDPDNDAVVYAPAAPLPAGSFFDTASGLFEWTPGFDQAGDYTLRFDAIDPGGLMDTIAVQVSVADVNRAPVPLFTNHQATLGETLRFRVGASDSDRNETLRFAARGLPEGATLDAANGDFAWTPGAGQAGDYLVIVAVSDGKATTERGLALRATQVPVGPSVTIALTPSFPAVPGQPVAITVLGDAFSAIASRTLKLNGAALALDERGRAIFTPPASGLYQLVATATDLDGFTSTTTGLLKVRDPLDSAAPVVALATDLDHSQITIPQAVVGRVSDSNLESWQLEIARAGSDRFIVVAQGTTAIDGGVLAQLDPAAFEAGPYLLRLTATDVAGRSALAQVAVELRPPLGAAPARVDTDFSAILAGHVLDFTRRNDVLAVDRAGSFGAGWRLAWRDVDLVTDLPPTGNESFGNYPPLVDGTRLFITLPTGERAGFTFAPLAVREGGVSFTRPHWVADPGVAWQLESADMKLMHAGDRTYTLDGSQPYNPAALFAERAQYTLSAPDGTRYEITAAQGVTGIVYPDGVRLLVTDSGVSASNGDMLRFVEGTGGSIAGVVLANGDVFSYEYGSDGRLASARNLSAAQSTRYAYDAAGRLVLVSAPTGGEALGYAGSAAVHQPLAADLGAALAYVGTSRSDSLAAAEVDRYAFSVRQSEIDATAGGAVLLGVVVGANSGDLIPALPQIAGVAPVFSRVQGNQAFALFRIDHAGLELLQIAGAGSGSYSMRMFVAGDANGDQRVDGRDADLLAAARRGAYNAAADVDMDGDVDASDSQLLYAGLGYAPNQAPTAGTTTLKTHVDLAVERSLGSILADPENDRLTLRIVEASHGTARITGDGRTLEFRPGKDFAGSATVTLLADDGYSSSGPTTLTINVSDARLLSIDFDHRVLRLRAGDQLGMRFVGDFADEMGVALPADYLTLATTDPAVATVSTAGLLTARADGNAQLIAMRGPISAATVIAVGKPKTAEDLYAYYFGIDAYPDSLAMTPGTERQMVIQAGEGISITDPAKGTSYRIGNSDIARIDASGKLVALATGDTTVTVDLPVGGAGGSCSHRHAADGDGGDRQGRRHRPGRRRSTRCFRRRTARRRCDGHGHDLAG